MITIAYYFLQVILCSALLMGYYWLVLRNNRFHQYNRFYLLMATVLAWIVPLIKIRWGHALVTEDPQVIRFLSVVADNNTRIEANLVQQSFQWNWDMMAPVVYFSVSLILFFGMIRSFARLYQLLKINSCKTVGDIYLVITHAKGTPFSFFRYIFWNDEIDLRSDAGKQILQHELTHVQQKHSFDKIFIQVVLIGGWFNPFFWLIKKEMNMIHEFIADRKAVAEGDTASLAQMLLTAAYPQQQFSLTNPFFFSPIKRRLQMLANHQNPRFSYIRRLVVLPLLAVVVVLFAFRNKEEKQVTLSVGTVVEKLVEKSKQIMVMAEMPVAGSTKKDTVIIQADTVYIHGKDKDDVVKIVPVNSHSNNPLLVVDGQKVPFSTMGKLDPNLIQSVDVLKGESATGTGYGEEGKNGIILITTKAFAAKTGKPLMIVDGEKRDYGTLNEISPEQIDRVDVLKNESATAKYGEEGKNGVVLITTKKAAMDQSAAASTKTKPGTLINIIESPTSGIVKMGDARMIDSMFTLGESMGKPIANPPLYILNGVKVPGVKIRMDDVKDINIIKDNKAIEKYGVEAKNGVVEITTKDAAPKNNQLVIEEVQLEKINPENRVLGMKEFKDRNPQVKDVFAMDGVDGSKRSQLTIKLKDGTYEDYDLTNAENKARAEKKYGKLPVFPVNAVPSKTSQLARGNNKNANGSPATLKGLQLFTVAQVPASFPGGLPGWTKYLERNLNRDMIAAKGGPPGKYTVVVSFIVDKEGNLSDIHAENDPGYGTKEEAERVIAKGPNWVPAEQNGQKVIYRHRQSITWVVAEHTDTDKHPVFTQTQTPASFPGGLPGWKKYLEHNLNRDMIVEKGAPPGKYTVVVSFIVDKEGNLSDIHAENDPGYGTKKEAERMITQGPKWVPAEQNGQKVNYRHRQSITWMISGDDLDVKMDGKKETAKNKKTEREIDFEKKLDQAKANNHKTFFYINGISCVITGAGSRAEMPGKVDLVIVNGKRMTPEALNQQFSRDAFILVASNDTDTIIDKYGKGILLVSSKQLTTQEINDLMK